MTPPSATPPCALPDSPLAHARAGLDTCVHCGFCLSTCPTYLRLEDENDSPRGRIVLMRALLEGTLDLDDPTPRRHLDQCLGCRACETACPSGVPYGQLLEAARATIAERHRPPFVAQLLLRTFEHPVLMRLAMAGARLLRLTGLPRLLSRLPGRIGFTMAMLAASARSIPARAYRARGDGSRGTVAVLEGCVMEGLYAPTNAATVRTLEANGWTPVRTPGQRCCGALHAHAGDLAAARRLARANILAFERSGATTIAVNAAGCGAMMKEYGHLLAEDPAWRDRALAMATRVRDASELLAAAGPRPGAPLPKVVTYDAPCHLVHAQRLARPPLAVLAAIPGLAVRPLEDADQCCGAAGIYNLIEPELSATVLAPKLAHIRETGAALVATGNPGCLLQIGAGLLQDGQPVRTVHPIDLLDASYAAER